MLPAPEDHAIALRRAGVPLPDILPRAHRPRSRWITRYTEVNPISRDRRSIYEANWLSRQTVELLRGFRLSRNGVRSREADFGGVSWWEGDLPILIQDACPGVRKGRFSFPILVR